MTPLGKCAINLNDFESFDRYLFGDAVPDWDRFYDKDSNDFIPPILYPETKPEYQLDHYALWMVISSFKLKHKPRISYNTSTTIVCYACQYKRYSMGVYVSCAEGCPLAFFNNEGEIEDFMCGEEYDDYIHAAISTNLNAVSLAAEKVAKMMWR